MTDSENAKKIKKNSYMQLFGGKEAGSIFERPDDSISWELFMKTYHKKEKELKEEIKTHRKLVKEYIKGTGRRTRVEAGFKALYLSIKQVNYQLSIFSFLTRSLD
jgi:hypothetical protein